MSGHNLTLGAGGQAPAWVGDPTRALGPFGSGGLSLLKYAVNTDLPFSTAGGANGLRAQSVFMYFKATSTPSGTQWLLNQLVSGSHLLKMQLIGGFISCQSNGTATAVTGQIVSGEECTVCLTTAATTAGKVRAFKNGVKVAETAVSATRTGYGAQPETVLGAEYYGFTGGAGAPGLCGRTLVYDGELSEAQVAVIHTRYRLDYPGLVP